MNAEILAVGTEILMGEIANTNAEYLSERLADMGINVYRHTVVGDNRDRLKRAVIEALTRADILITTGGLGPTPDDLTKETLAECMGAKLVLDEESLDRMKAYFAKTNREMPENNIKQAMMPEGSVILQNDHGTAPGCIMTNGTKTIIMLPGPPVEMRPMFEAGAAEYLKGLSGQIFYSRVYRLFGIGESAAAERLDDLMENSQNPTVAPYAKTGEVRIRVTARCENAAEGEEIISTVRDEIYSQVGEYIYSDDGKSLCETVVARLTERGMTVTTAESCTGGYIAKQITDVAGASEVFKEGFVTYSNEAKMKYLNVSADTLAEHGAVSRETAYEMASGLKTATGADIAAAVTGIAGPGGGTPEKPVGLVYAAVAHAGGVEVKELHLHGTRERIRELTCLNVFDMIRRIIN